MKIHHLNCGSFCPIGARLVGSVGGYLERGSLVCHCLLVETANGLVLVDTGFGLDDVRNPTARLGLGLMIVGAPQMREEETAVRQIEHLGFDRRDVRHIVVTHLDFDHAGGLPDFPEAAVHVYAPEHAAAHARATLLARGRYLPHLWAHGPRWACHEIAGDRWLGFDAVRLIDPREPDVLLIPLVGHTLGHAGVAVRTPRGYVLHAGDAYYFHEETDPERPFCPPGLALMQRAVETKRAPRLANQARLRALRREHGGHVEVFCAHDPSELPSAHA